MTDHDFRIGIGQTEELSLRVSVATLVRVLFKHPEDGKWMLALERKATLRASETGPLVQLVSQPFGGAVRILDVGGLQRRIGNFHFDSEGSQFEQDFRIFIRRSDWPTIRDLCIDQFSSTDHRIIETDPTRELAEEFSDSLKLDLSPGHYSIRPACIIIEDVPAPTANIYASGYLTVRAYRIFEARILDDSLSQIILSNSAGISDQLLCELAAADARRSGKGRANAVLTLPLGQLTAAYLAVSTHERSAPISFAGHTLDETVAAVLDNVDIQKYQRLF